MLVIMRDELYEGSWDDMLRDLEERRAGKPYIFKLASRIDDDIARLKKLQSYEGDHDVNLADYLKGDEWLES